MTHRIATVSALLSLAGQALAHPGHGQPSASHWHASDVFGYAVLALLVAAALWFGRRK